MDHVHALRAHTLGAQFEDQRGLVTVRQLRDAGVTPDALRWRIGRTWRLVLPRVVAVAGVGLDPTQRMIAALLYAGPGAVITSSAAAAWYGVTAAGGLPRITVEVPVRRGPGGAGFVVVRRTVRPDPGARSLGGLLLACPARSVAAAARDAADPQVCRAVVLEAVQRGVADIEQIRQEVELGQRIGSALPRAALREAEAGAWSIPEADLLALLARSRLLPQIWANPSLIAADGHRLPRPDGWFDDVALAVQVHSRRFHSGELDWERTVMTDGVFAEYGIPVVAVTPRAIADDPGGVRRRVERAYRSAAQRPRTPVIARPTGYGLLRRLSDDGAPHAARGSA